MRGRGERESRGGEKRGRGEGESRGGQQLGRAERENSGGEQRERAERESRGERGGKAEVGEGNLGEKEVGGKSEE